MSKAKRSRTTREKHEQYRRYTILTHILLCVVALIECFILLSFTTYSWIESSSSLIIASGEKNGVRGAEDMAISKNLHYQVLVSLDASGSVSLVGNPAKQSDDLGVYRSIECFSYAKTTSPDGKTFYFRRPSDLNTGLSGASLYRVGDTTDYNTSYTYLDFEIKNTTKSSKTFYFASSQVFTSSSEGMNNTITHNDAEYTVKQIIFGAMRISLSKNGEAATVFSVSGNSSTCPLNANGELSDTTLTSNQISNYVFTGNIADIPVFESYTTGTDVTDKIAIRVWFDYTDSVYSALSENNKSAVDAVLNGSEISLDFSLINDNVAFDRIYFDDYALSEMSPGKFVTQENAACGMYLHVYNDKMKDYLNYPMYVDSSYSGDGVRWVTAVPLPYVVSGRLTDTSSEYFAGAYFFYGNTSGSNPNPAEIAYKWSLPGAMALSSDGKSITFGKYYRNLGVIRTESNYDTRLVSNYDGTGIEPINGFLQVSDNSSDSMTMVYFRDMASGLTDNTSFDFSTDGYITSARSIVAIAPRIVDGFDYSKLYYYDLDKTDASVTTRDDASYIKAVVSEGNGGDNHQTVNIEMNLATDNGSCYQVTDNSKYYGQYNVQKLSITLPGTDDPDKIRIYFYNKTNPTGWSWDDGRVKVWVIGESMSWPGRNMIHSEEVTTRASDRMYINKTLASDSDSAEDQAVTAKSTVQMLYDTGLNLWKAYVPSSWITSGGSYFHYNGNLTYYKDIDDPNNDSDTAESLSWAAGVGSANADEQFVYTALGYTDAKEPDELICGTGVGTWDDIRTVSFDTELIDTDISGSYVYKLGFGTGQYPMISADDTGMSFTGYVPVGASVDGDVIITSYAAYDSAAVTGYWAVGAFGNTETTYYPVTKVDSVSSSVRGYFHIAVFVDGTFDNLVNGIKTDTSSMDNVTSLLTAVKSDGGDAFDLFSNGTIDNHRWYVPCTADTVTVTYTWTPYDYTAGTDTVFEFTQNLSNGIFFVITEAAGS